MSGPISNFEKPDSREIDDEPVSLIPPSTPIGAGIELENSEDWPEELALTDLGVARARLEADLFALREQTALLKETLRVIAYRSRVIVNDEATYLHSTARAQLGDYPWAKLGAAIGVTFIATRLARLALR